MKMVFVVYSQAADYAVVPRLKQAGVLSYTKLEEATGEGRESEPKLGTHAWSGENNVLYLAVQDDEALVIADLIRSMKKEHPRAGIRGFIMPLEEIV